MLNINANILQAKRNISLPYPVTLNPVLYLSRTNGKFDTSESGGDTYVNKWIDPYSGKEATQDTGDYRPKLVSGGVEFDGTNDYLKVSDSVFDYNDELTISSYFKTTDPGSGACQVVQDPVDNDYKVIHGYRNLLRMYVVTASGSSDTNDASGYMNGEWHHLLSVYDRYASDGNRLKVYINGELKLTATGYDEPITDSQDALYIATKYNELLNGFNGCLDEISVYLYVLSESQITDIYNYIRQLKGI